ncbi:MAG TPA: putative N-acetylmannosamine-6-phosphate 2-epimerase [Terriglobia bacterium]|nr:putative N-acetylmannosamine-6-phosphate 2-epimerase [Terriglobia bacterium]
MIIIPEVCKRFYRQLVVSCQAAEGDPLRNPDVMTRFARAAVDGGAAGIRANGEDDVRAIRAAVQVPIIGIWKSLQTDGRILITSSFDEAKQLVRAGADLIALDCTTRGQRLGAFDRLRQIKAELGVPVMADIATRQEAQAAEAAGADLVATTLRGYTAETEHIRSFDSSFAAELIHSLSIPVVVEGRIGTPEQARKAIAMGAFAVIVGTAITCPREMTRRFVNQIQLETSSTQGDSTFIGIDLGATNTKFGLVSRDGELRWTGTEPTPQGGGRQVLLDHLKKIARQALDRSSRLEPVPRAMGIATAGWVNPFSGEVVYATENLPGWTGAQIAAPLRDHVGMPVAVENDANALAVGERVYGIAKNVNDFVCMTLGTGLGGGCYIRGKLNRGAHFFANALGHITVQDAGEPCSCGQRGCLEVYTNAAALVRYAENRFPSAEEVIKAANAADDTARKAIQTLSRFLAIGAANIVHLNDPELLVLAGGLVQNNPILLSEFTSQLEDRITVREKRHLRISVSQLGYYAGVYGAAAVAGEIASQEDAERAGD